MTPQSLLKVLKATAEQKGYFLHADEEHCLATAESLLENKQRYGYLCCPCRLATSLTRTRISSAPVSTVMLTSMNMVPVSARCSWMRNTGMIRTSFPMWMSVALRKTWTEWRSVLTCVFPHISSASRYPICGRSHR